MVAFDCGSAIKADSPNPKKTINDRSCGSISITDPILGAGPLADISEYQVPRALGRTLRYIGVGSAIPAQIVGPAVFASDLLLLILMSVGSGIGYHEYLLGEPGDITTFVGLACAVFFYFSMFLAYRGNYAPARLIQPGLQCRELTVAWIAVFLILVTLAFLLKVGPNLSRGTTITFFVTGWCGLVGWRGLLSLLLQRARTRQVIASRTAVVISDRKKDEAAACLKDLAAHGYKVARFVVLPGSDEALAESAEGLLAMGRLRTGVDSFFLLMDWSDPDRIDRVAEILRALPCSVRLFPDAKVSRFLGRQVSSVGAGWAAEIQRAPLSIEERIAKRALDIVVSSMMLIVLSPLMLAAAILVCATSRGPAFFMQTRTGFNGLPFRILKFRTLTSMDDGPVVKQVRRGDERLTRVGKALRRSSIDELPQLVNILRGEMSLVGPRPHATAHTDYFGDLIANYAYRHHVKPGLTGWAQVNGFRGETTLDQMRARVEHDLWYIDNWNLWLDIKILLKTCMVLLRASAY
jgi:Undecaprenyl-phosphate glucose phosphotransferase